MKQTLADTKRELILNNEKERYSFRKVTILKIMKRFIIISALAFIAGTGSVIAQRVTPKINHNQKTQKVLIAQGVATGELTVRETAVLVAEQNQIQRLEYRAKADGVITRRERALIRQEQREAKRHIRRQNNDRQSRN